MSKPSPPEITPYSYAKWWRRPHTPDRPPLHWYLLSRAFALTMWTLPRRYRFRAAALLSRALAPVVRRTPLYRAHRRLRIDGVSELALYYALEIMTNSGASFDPALEVEGSRILSDALERGEGVLLIAPHALLSQLIFRPLYDMGHVPTVISAAPLAHVYGTRLVVRAVQPSPTFMIRVRSVLRNGGVVCAMVDGEHAAGQGLVNFTTAEGTMVISDALIRLALRCKARVLFTSVRIDRDRGALLTIAEPATTEGLTAETVTKDFARYIQAHIAAVAFRQAV